MTRRGAGLGFLTPVRRRLAMVAGVAGGVSLLLGASMVSDERMVDPCCGVISVDANTGVVTAYELKSGNIFKFTVKDAAQLSTIKPCQSFEAELAGLQNGQAFAAKFGAGDLSRTAAAGAARVNPADPCCSMTTAPGTAGRVLGVQQHAKYEEVDILLLSLERSTGEVVTATCLYCNGGATQVDLASDMRARSREAKLLDTENQVEYRVERPGGEAGKALVSEHGPGLKLAPNRTVKTWMKFTAPEGSKVTLIVPGASEPFEDVSIAAK